MDLTIDKIQDQSITTMYLTVCLFSHQQLAFSESCLLAIIAKISYQIAWPMTLAPTYEAIQRETSGKSSIREKPVELLSTGNSVKIVYYHQLSVMFVRVWRCFFGIVRSYLRYCILALSNLFCYGICDSIIYVISVYFVNDGKLHCLMCVNTHSLNWIHFPLWTLIDSFVWIGIVHGILFDISRWYHCIWWILYTCKVIKGNACAYYQDCLVLPVFLFYQWA